MAHYANIFVAVAICLGSEEVNPLGGGDAGYLTGNSYARCPTMEGQDFGATTSFAALFIWDAEQVDDWDNPEPQYVLPFYENGNNNEYWSAALHVDVIAVPTKSCEDKNQPDKESLYAVVTNGFAGKSGSHG